LFYKFIPLPPNFDPVDATVKEVMAYRRESYSTVRRKLRLGLYESYLDGDRRMIIFASVKADREQSIAKGPQLIPENPAVKRNRGRPRKTVAPLASRPVA
jgi:hypothetical protein